MMSPLLNDYAVQTERRVAQELETRYDRNPELGWPMGWRVLPVITAPTVRPDFQAWFRLVVAHAATVMAPR